MTADRTARVACSALVALAGSACMRGTGAAHGAAIAPAPAACERAEAATRHLLYFGRNVPGGGVVADSAIRTFLAEEVARRFPAGFTIWDATGHWQGASGRPETERTTVLLLVQPASGSVDSLVRAVAHAYKQRFSQEAVLHERSAVCSRLE
jgi:hypothetical protein